MAHQKFIFTLMTILSKPTFLGSNLWTQPRVQVLWFVWTTLIYVYARIYCDTHLRAINDSTGAQKPYHYKWKMVSLSVLSHHFEECDFVTWALNLHIFLFGIEELMLYGCCIYVEIRQYMHILKNPMHLWFRKEGAHVKKTVDKTA